MFVFTTGSFGRNAVRGFDYIPPNVVEALAAKGISFNAAFEADYARDLAPFTLSGAPAGAFNGYWFEAGVVDSKHSYNQLNGSGQINWISGWGASGQWVFWNTDGWSVLAVSNSDTDTPFTASWDHGQTVTNEGAVSLNTSGDIIGFGWQEPFAQRIADAGFSHIRIPINWDIFDRTGPAPDSLIHPDFLDAIAAIVDQCLDKGLFVVINFHNHWVLMDTPNTANAHRFNKQWRQVATRFKDYSGKLIFEILNEPRFQHLHIFEDFMQVGLNAIRMSNPTRVVSYTSNFGGQVATVPFLNLPADPNLLVDTHYYEPFNFTHQGATWVGDPSAPEQWQGTRWLDTPHARGEILHHFSKLLELRFGPPPDAIVIEGIKGHPAQERLNTIYPRIGDILGRPAYQKNIDGSNRLLQWTYAGDRWDFAGGAYFCAEWVPAPELTMQWISTTGISTAPTAVRRAHWFDFPQLLADAPVLQPVFCGEFSVISNADTVSRCLYNRFIAATMRSLKIGHSAWGFGGAQPGFSFFDRSSDNWREPLLTSISSWQPPTQPKGTVSSFLAYHTFANTNAGWTTNVFSPAQATWANSPTGLRVSVSENDPAPWRIRLIRNDLSFTQGKQYHVKVRFEANEAAVTSRIHLAVGKNTDDQELVRWFSSYQTHYITDGLNEVRFSFQMNTGTDAASRMVINLGAVNTGSIIDFKEVSILEVSPPQVGIFQGHSNDFYLDSNWVDAQTPDFGGHAWPEIALAESASTGAMLHRNTHLGGLSLSRIPASGYELRLRELWQDSNPKDLIFDADSGHSIIESSADNGPVTINGSGRILLCNDLDIINNGARITINAPILDQGAIIEDSFQYPQNSGWFGDLTEPTINTTLLSLSASERTGSNGTIGVSLLRYFHRLTLNPGDSLELHFRFKQNPVTPGANAFRFGILDSTGARISDQSAYANSLFEDYQGYVIGANYNRDTITSYSFNRRNPNTTNSHIVLQAATLTSLDTISEAVGQIQNNSQTPDQIIRLSRDPNGYGISTTLGGSSDDPSRPAISSGAFINDPEAFTTFDTIDLWFRNTTNNNATIDDIEITDLKVVIHRHKRHTLTLKGTGEFALNGINNIGNFIVADEATLVT